MSSWNFADVWEVVARVRPSETALVHGARRISWSDFDCRAEGVAAALLEAGVTRQDKVALYLYNCPEFLEATFAAMKAALVPVNTNYRYTEDELAYLWDDADVVAVVFHRSFSAAIERLHERLPKIRLWLCVDDGSGACPEWATSYEEKARSRQRVAPEWGRSADDLYLLYTGGTTGKPKGVMWRQDDLFAYVNRSAAFAESGAVSYPEEGTLEDVRRMVRDSHVVHLCACPLMHGTGALTSFRAISSGGRVVTLAGRSFDPRELLGTVVREQVETIVIVGDAFAKPITTVLDAEPDRWDISSVVSILSSGAMWSESVKRALLRHHAGMRLMDALSSSEAPGMGLSVSAGAEAAATGHFVLGANAAVIRDDGTVIEPGSGEVGQIAVRGRIPIGYYRDPAKTSQVFPVLGGERFSVPGDHAIAEADGTLRLLGRGATCINTGGEKVYPEEVEEAIKTHPDVHDAAVVGLPDETMGEIVVAAVHLNPRAAFDEAALIAHVKSRLAGYKAPKRVVALKAIDRGPTAKLDYVTLRGQLATLIDAGHEASSA